MSGAVKNDVLLAWDLLFRFFNTNLPFFGSTLEITVLLACLLNSEETISQIRDLFAIGGFPKKVSCSLSMLLSFYSIRVAFLWVSSDLVRSFGSLRGLFGVL